MKSSTIYARRIFRAKSGNWNQITDEIYTYCGKKNIDPYIILSIYYIEDYFRPYWLQLVEIVLYKIRILRNPSIGPFQVRISNLKELHNSDSVTLASLKHVVSVLKMCGLDKKRTKNGFLQFGEKYNLDSSYGFVLMELHSMLRKVKWVARMSKYQ